MPEIMSEIEVPQYGVEVQEFEGNMLMFLVITVSGIQTKSFLCTAEQNYQHVAKQIHDGICKAGNEARRHASGLVVVKDLPDGMKNGRTIR